MPNSKSANDWWPNDEDSIVQAYINAHYEFNWDWIESGRPYCSTPWSKEFVSVPHSNAWKLRRDHILNGLTADLIATVELLGIVFESDISSGSPGGIGAEGMTVWLPFLDGGLFVDFLQYESQYSNHINASQKTLVFGPMALRYLLTSLGFELPKRGLKGEGSITQYSKIEKLLELQTDSSSVEAEELRINIKKSYKMAESVASRV